MEGTDRPVTVPSSAAGAAEVFQERGRGSAPWESQRLGVTTSGLGRIADELESIPAASYGPRVFADAAKRCEATCPFSRNDRLSPVVEAVRRVGCLGVVAADPEERADDFATAVELPRSDLLERVDRFVFP
jgi:hypothetical protein